MAKSGCRIIRRHLLTNIHSSRGSRYSQKWQLRVILDLQLVRGNSGATSLTQSQLATDISLLFGRNSVMEHGSLRSISEYLIPNREVHSNSGKSPMILVRNPQRSLMLKKSRKSYQRWIGRFQITDPSLV